MSGTILNLCARVGDLLSTELGWFKMSIPVDSRGAGTASSVAPQGAAEACLST